MISSLIQVEKDDLFILIYRCNITISLKTKIQKYIIYIASPINYYALKDNILYGRTIIEIILIKLLKVEFISFSLKFLKYVMG